MGGVTDEHFESEHAMRTIGRGFRSISESPATGLLVCILAVSIGLTLIMITVDNAFAKRLDDIKSQVGSNITVRPAGSFGGGFFGRVASVGRAAACPAARREPPATQQPTPPLTDGDSPGRGLPGLHR